MEKLHFIMPGISFCFSVKPSDPWLARGNFLISTVTEVISAFLQLQSVPELCEAGTPEL